MSSRALRSGVMISESGWFCALRSLLSAVLRVVCVKAEVRTWVCCCYQQHAVFSAWKVGSPISRGFSDFKSVPNIDPNLCNPCELSAYLTLPQGENALLLTFFSPTAPKHTTSLPKAVLNASVAHLTVTQYVPPLSGCCNSVVYLSFPVGGCIVTDFLLPHGSQTYHVAT